MHSPQKVTTCDKCQHLFKSYLHLVHFRADHQRERSAWYISSLNYSIPSKAVPSGRPWNAGIYNSAETQIWFLPIVGGAKNHPVQQQQLNWVCHSLLLSIHKLSCGQLFEEMTSKRGGKCQWNLKQQLTYGVSAMNSQHTILWRTINMNKTNILYKDPCNGRFKNSQRIHPLLTILLPWALQQHTKVKS